MGKKEDPNLEKARQAYEEATAADKARQQNDKKARGGSGEGSGDASR